MTNGSEIDLWWATGEGRLAGTVRHLPAKDTADSTANAANHADVGSAGVESQAMLLAAAASAAYFAGPMLVTDLAHLQTRPAKWTRRLRRIFGS